MARRRSAVPEVWRRERFASCDLKKLAWGTEYEYNIPWHERAAMAGIPHRYSSRQRDLLLFAPAASPSDLESSRREDRSRLASRFFSLRGRLWIDSVGHLRSARTARRRWLDRC